MITSEEVSTERYRSGLVAQGDRRHLEHCEECVLCIGGVLIVEGHYIYRQKLPPSFIDIASFAVFHEWKIPKMNCMIENQNSANLCHHSPSCSKLYNEKKKKNNQQQLSKWKYAYIGDMFYSYLHCGFLFKHCIAGSIERWIPSAPDKPNWFITGSVCILCYSCHQIWWACGQVLRNKTSDNSDHTALVRVTDQSST